jgi:hypothetical protein
MAQLHAQPIRKQPVPSYPSRLDAQNDPQLLMTLPPAWLARPEVRGAAGLFLAASLTGCDGNSDARSAPGSPPPPVPVVAPVFEHGKGLAPDWRPSRGMLGCVAVAAPVYLSEEEARQIIAEELARVGVDVHQQDVTLPTVVITGCVEKLRVNWQTEMHEIRYEDVSGPLAVDLFDPQRHVGVEYISGADYESLGGTNDETQWSIDLKTVAASVGDEVRTHGNGIYFGTFYDPVHYWQFSEAEEIAREARESTPSQGDGDPVSSFDLMWEGMGEARARAQVDAEHLLRQQVQDFAEWLKAQGAI